MTITTNAVPPAASGNSGIAPLRVVVADDEVEDCVDDEDPVETETVMKVDARLPLLFESPPYVAVSLGIPRVVSE